jgi:hypothetical protein
MSRRDRYVNGEPPQRGLQRTGHELATLVMSVVTVDGDSAIQVNGVATRRASRAL